MALYSYSKSPCNIDKLKKEILDSEITTILDYLSYHEGILSVFFEEELESGEITILDGLVDAHDGEPLPDFIVNELTLDSEQRAQLDADDAARLFSNRLTAYLKVLNQAQGMTLAQSLWAHHRLRALEITITEAMATAIPSVSPLVGQTVIIDSMNLVISGDVQTAYFVFAYATPDDMTMDFHSVSSDFLGLLRNQIGIYLGWET